MDEIHGMNQIGSAMEMQEDVLVLSDELLVLSTVARALPGQSRTAQELSWRQHILCCVNWLEVRERELTAAQLAQPPINLSYTPAMWRRTQSYVYGNIRARQPRNADMPHSHLELLRLIESGEYFHVIPLDDSAG